VVKVVGALYLGFLGVMALWGSRRAASTDHMYEQVAGGPVLSAWAALRLGLLTNVLNPKVAVFFVALLPQFIPAGGSTVAGTATLAAVFIAMTGGYLLLIVALTVRATGWLSRPGVRRRLDRLAGVVFIGFGVRLALADR
jgi:threonine/homoserine/homoserine lactone efflux protein